MIKVHRKVEYSLMALKHMSAKRGGELTTAKEVSDSYHAPFEAVARSLQIMAQRGLVKSSAGVQGGYQLNRELDQITLLELVELMEGPTEIAKCLTKNGPCEIKKHCNIISPIEELNTRLSDFYRSLSLKDLLKVPAREVEL